MVDDGGRKTPCCRTADVEDLERQPELFDCTSCGVARVEALWPENAEAWECYQALCGRTVRDCELRPWVLSQITEGWSWAERSELLARLDVISTMVSPESTRDGGSDQT